MRAFAAAGTGTNDTTDEWLFEYASLCSLGERSSASTEYGIDLPTFRRIANGEARQRYHLSDQELVSIAQSVAGARILKEWISGEEEDDGGGRGTESNGSRDGYHRGAPQTGPYT